MKTDFRQKPFVVFTCDTCKTQGLLNHTIFNHEGWYYCLNCLAEIKELAENLRQNIHQPRLF